MIATDVGSVDVVQKDIDVVNPVVDRRVVDGQCPLYRLLDDNTLGVQRRGFNLMKRTLEFVSEDSLNLRQASNGCPSLLSGQIRGSKVRERCILDRSWCEW